MELHSGRTADEMIGRSLLDLFPEISARGVDDYYDAALAGRVTVLAHGLHHFLLRFLPTNRDLGMAEMPQSGRIGPLSVGGEVIGTLTIIDDVSERVATEAVLRKQIEAQRIARDTAETALRAKDEFLSVLSHEIRSPLNAVLGWARILLTRNTVDQDLVKRAMQVIERNAKAQAKMIDDMLDMARIVAGKLRLEIQPVDLLSVILSAVDGIMPAANAKGIAVHTNLDPTTPSVLGDQDRLQQVIWNLLSNALKFTESGGTIDVRLEATPKRARILVSDTGQGIGAEFLPHVFERFQQNDSSSARRHGGLGLGLALVRELVDLHGGSVRATSEGHNKGATFSVELPTVTFPEADRNQPDDAASAGKNELSLRGVRVLVVEDESDARDITVMTLEHFGAQVISATCSSDAIAAIKACSAAALPHVLVSDLGMPGQDSYDLIRQIRSLKAERGGRIKAVTLTGYATPDDVHRAIAAGYQLHVSKPIDPSALVSAIASLVRDAEIY